MQLLMLRHICGRAHAFIEGDWRGMRHCAPWFYLCGFTSACTSLEGFGIADRLGAWICPRRLGVRTGVLIGLPVGLSIEASSFQDGVGRHNRPVPVQRRGYLTA